MNQPDQVLPETEKPRLRRNRSLGSWLEAHLDSAALTVVALGFVLRLRAAWGIFLNPDEALHFFIANRDSWAMVYKASLTMAHPPLLFLVLYSVRHLGTSEFLLRLPSVLAGTAFCWIFYKWAAEIFGQKVALIGLMFVALLGPLVDLSAEVRHYELLLLFLISSAYFFEQALARSSPERMLLSAACLYLAMLSHYSAFLFAVAIGVYSLLRVVGRGTPLRVRVAWIAGQAGALGLAIFLYLNHISKIQGTTMADVAFNTWLYKSYFHRGDGNPLVFVVVRSFSLFQYCLGQLVIGDIAALLFVTGIVFLLRGKLALKPGPTTRWTPILLVLPFAMNCVAALLDRYPYGGTRHCVFLVIFAVAGVASCLVKLTGERITRGVAVAALVVLLCYAVRSTHQPFIARADQSLARMKHAAAFVRERIPVSDPIIVDYESGLVLGHYLCEQRPISYDGSIEGFLVFHCGGHRIVSTVSDLWFFTPQTFLNQWRALLRNGGLRPDQVVWIGQAGWNVDLDDELRTGFPEFHNLQTKSFGNNIRFFKLAADQAMPSAASAEKASQPR